jgi:hypothetical protein
VLHPVRRDEVDQLPVSEHVREFIRAAFDLDDQATGEHRLARNAHNLGYRGHGLTKSRRYSTTFKRLREAREDHIHAQLRGDQATADDQRKLAELGRDHRVSHFTFVGAGHLTAAEAFLAAQAAAKAREHRRLARDALADLIGIRQS